LMKKRVFNIIGLNSCANNPLQMLGKGNIGIELNKFDGSYN